MNTIPPDLDRITAEYLEGLLSAGGPPPRLFTLGYVSLVELGNLFVDLEDWEWRYGELLKAAGPFLIERLVGLPTPSCLLCCEKDPAQCHRRLIAEYMAARGWTVEHIL